MGHVCRSTFYVLHLFLYLIFTSKLGTYTTGKVINKTVKCPTFVIIFAYGALLYYFWNKAYKRALCNLKPHLKISRSRPVWEKNTKKWLGSNGSPQDATWFFSNVNSLIWICKMLNISLLQTACTLCDFLYLQNQTK